MKLLFVTFAALSIDLAHSGCHTGTTDDEDKRLGITVDSTSGFDSGTDSNIYANIYTDGAWAGWRKLDNSNCNDHQKGATDYFDDFEDYTSDWEAIGLYNCGNDGFRINGVYYWNGEKEKFVNYWYENVFGSFGVDNCLMDDRSTSNGRYRYHDIFIDGNTECCDGAIFTTATTADAWLGDLPGKPDCSGEEGNVVPMEPKHYTPSSPANYFVDTTTQFEETLLHYLMAAIGIAMLLFIANSFFIAAMMRRSVNPTDFKAYDKVINDIE